MQIPESFKQASLKNRQSLLESASLLNHNHNEDTTNTSNKIDYFKRELQSITQERIVMTTITKSMLREIKSSTPRNASINTTPSTTTTTTKTNKNKISSISKNNNDQKLAKSSSVSTATHSRRDLMKGRMLQSNISNGNPLDNPISIPEYAPPPPSVSMAHGIASQLTTTSNEMNEQGKQNRLPKVRKISYVCTIFHRDTVWFSTM